MRTRPLLIGLDGLCGTGKTTVGRVLTSATGATLVRVPPAELRSVSLWFAREAEAHPAVAAAFFVSGLGMALVEASRHRAAGGSCVLDRYLWSTLAPLAALGVPLDDMMGFIPPVRVDLKVLLTCSERTREQRLATRMERSILQGRLTDAAYRRSVLDSQGAFEFDLVLETDGLEPESVARVIMEASYDGAR